MTLSFGRVGLWCLTPLSTKFQLYRHFVGDLWKPVKISMVTLIFKDHLSVYSSIYLLSFDHVDCCFVCVYDHNVLRNIYCCRHQISNWYRQISKYNINTAISFVMQYFWFLVFNPTFSNISAILWRPVSVVEEAGVSGEKHRPWASNW